MLLKFRITYKRFFREKQFDIEAFSLASAIVKFNAIFPKYKLISIVEVTNEP